MKYKIRKITENIDTIQVEVEFQESNYKFDEGDRFVHCLPKSIDWEAKDPKTGNTKLYEKIQSIVKKKVGTTQVNSSVENLKKWQNLQFDSDW